MPEISCRCATGQWCSPAGKPGTYLNQALHWNGHKWSRSTTPNPAGTATGTINSLSGVYCSAKNNCWAVGSAGDPSAGGSVATQALHRNGVKWSSR